MAILISTSDEILFLMSSLLTQSYVLPVIGKEDKFILLIAI